MKKFTSIILMVMLLGAMAIGSPLNKSRVSGDANWMLHLDQEALYSSTLGKLILKELEAQGANEKLAGFKTAFSFNPIEDIKSVTIYGQGQDKKKAVAIFRASYDQAVLTSLVNMNPQYEVVNHGKHIIHSWVDEKNTEGERVYGAFYGNDTVVMSVGKDALVHSLDVMDGKAESLKDLYLYDLDDFQDENEGVFIIAAAKDVQQATKGIEQAAVLNQTNRFAVAIGEDDSTAYINMVLEAKTAEDAMKIQQFAQGMLALVSLQASEAMPELGKVASAFKITTNDRELRLHFAWDSKDLMAIAKKAAELDKNKKVSLDF